jgi:hypothetical protein
MTSRPRSRGPPCRGPTGGAALAGAQGCARGAYHESRTLFEPRSLAIRSSRHRAVRAAAALRRRGARPTPTPHAPGQPRTRQLLVHPGPVPCARRALVRPPHGAGLLCGQILPPLRAGRRRRRRRGGWGGLGRCSLPLPGAPRCRDGAPLVQDACHCTGWRAAVAQPRGGGGGLKPLSQAKGLSTSITAAQPQSPPHPPRRASASCPGGGPAPAPLHLRRSICARARSSAPPVRGRVPPLLAPLPLSCPAASAIDAAAAPLRPLSPPGCWPSGSPSASTSAAAKPWTARSSLWLASAAAPPPPPPPLPSPAADTASVGWRCPDDGAVPAPPAATPPPPKAPGPAGTLAVLSGDPPPPPPPASCEPPPLLAGRRGSDPPGGAASASGGAAGGPAPEATAVTASSPSGYTWTLSRDSCGGGEA